MLINKSCFLSYFFGNLNRETRLAVIGNRLLGRAILLKAFWLANRRHLIKPSAYMIIFICIGAKYQSAELVGYVVSTSGKPIPNVFVYSRTLSNIEMNDPSPYQYTDSRGMFKLAKPGKVIFLQHSGYRPLAKVVDTPTRRIEITLEDAIASERIIPICAKSNISNVFLGSNIRMPLSPEMEVKTSKNIDSSTTSFGYKKNTTVFWLNLWVVSSHGFPNEELVLSSSNVFSCSVRRGEKEGVEMMGHSIDGKYWRHVSVGLNEISYQDVPVDVATQFDKMINGMCFNE